MLARAFPIELKDGMRAEAAVVNRDLRFRSMSRWRRWLRPRTQAATTGSVAGELLGEPIPTG